MDSGQQFLHDTRYAVDMPEQQSDQEKGLPQPPLELPFDDSMPIIDLPEPRTLVIPSIDLRTAIDRRHSFRLYRDEALTLDELSFLLWCTQGVKAVTKRPCTPVSYTHLRAHETDSYLVCRLLLEKKNNHKNDIH